MLNVVYGVDSLTSYQSKTKPFANVYGSKVLTSMLQSGKTAIPLVSYSLSVTFIPNPVTVVVYAGFL